jgi:hypothetical protein
MCPKKINKPKPNQPSVKKRKAPDEDLVDASAAGLAAEAEAEAGKKIPTIDASPAGLADESAAKAGKKMPTADASAAGVAANAAAKAVKKMPTTDASADGLVAQVEAEAGKNTGTVPMGVDSTYGSSYFGSYKTAASSETKKGGAGSFYRSPN